jgi:hypothetical protein
MYKINKKYKTIKKLKMQAKCFKNTFTFFSFWSFIFGKKFLEIF